MGKQEDHKQAESREALNRLDRKRELAEVRRRLALIRGEMLLRKIGRVPSERPTEDDRKPRRC